MVKYKLQDLNKLDKRILFELDINCRTPTSLIAKKLNKSRQTIEYRINNLKEKKIIDSFNTSINPYRIGYKYYKFYFKLRNIPAEKDTFLNYIRHSGKIFWFGICSGKYDLIAAVHTKSDSNFLDIKNEIISNFKNIIIDYDMDILVYTKQYPKMYFTNQIRPSTYFGGEIIENKLDKEDHKILETIVNNGQISYYDLSKKINTVPSTAKNKIKRMEELGIIIQYRIGVNLATLGLELYKAIIDLEKYNNDIEKDILEYVSNIPNISYYIKNIQRLELEFIVENYQQYYDIIENIKKRFPYVIKSVDVVLMLTDEWTPGFKSLLTI